MKINQFSITKTNSEQKLRELKMLHLLRANEATELDPTQMWLTLLARTHMASEQPIAVRQWLHDLLATPTLAIDEVLLQQSQVALHHKFCDVDLIIELLKRSSLRQPSHLLTDMLGNRE